MSNLSVSRSPDFTSFSLDATQEDVQTLQLHQSDEAASPQEGKAGMGDGATARGLRVRAILRFERSEGESEELIAEASLLWDDPVVVEKWLAWADANGMEIRAVRPANGRDQEDEVLLRFSHTSPATE